MSIRRRFDTPAESAQARWQRRSTLPATAPAPSSTTTAQDSAGRSSPVTAEELKPQNSGAAEETKRNITGSVVALHRRGTSSPNPFIPATAVQNVAKNPTMEAIRLQKKYPQVTQSEMFQLIEKFKYTASLRFQLWLTYMTQRDRYRYSWTSPKNVGHQCFAKQRRRIL
jgi:hypothetical protein